MCLDCFFFFFFYFLINYKFSSVFFCSLNDNFYCFFIFFPNSNHLLDKQTYLQIDKPYVFFFYILQIRSSQMSFNITFPSKGSNLTYIVVFISRTDSIQQCHFRLKLFYPQLLSRNKATQSLLLTILYLSTVCKKRFMGSLLHVCKIRLIPFLIFFLFFKIKKFYYFIIMLFCVSLNGEKRTFSRP